MATNNVNAGFQAGGPQPTMTPEQMQAYQQQIPQLQAQIAQLQQQVESLKHVLPAQDIQQNVQQPIIQSQQPYQQNPMDFHQQQKHEQPIMQPPQHQQQQIPQMNDEQGEIELRRDPMMTHLMDSLYKREHIGHYGLLTYAMIARHFLSRQSVIRMLMLDPQSTEESANLLYDQVSNKDYSPPKRDRILEWQSMQEFPIIPNTSDDSCGNVYKHLHFPAYVYEHISQYYQHHH
eukprot:TRINITY_DN474_c0_g1_i1.p1 TRINITY_DN474_c0_g1~~TRINITY_DN474_c0_g1_i1.p1  ORF type:complete len:233 (-),score=59.65 TRINITY_DN474_c0_g1_i1:219-917(-)